LNYV
jgi:hypothetical protein